MKKRFAVLLVLITAMVSACGNNGTDSSHQGPTSSQQASEKSQGASEHPDTGSDDSSVAKDDAVYPTLNTDDFLEGAWYSIRIPSEGLIAVMNAAQHIGYIDYSGKQIVPFKYNDARDFSNGFAAVNQAGLWGFIDTKGNEIVKPKYSECTDFYGNYALARDANNSAALLVDKTGKETKLQTNTNNETASNNFNTNHITTDEVKFLSNQSKDTCKQNYQILPAVLGSPSDSSGGILGSPSEPVINLYPYSVINGTNIIVVGGQSISGDIHFINNSGEIIDFKNIPTSIDPLALPLRYFYALEKAYDRGSGSLEFYNTIYLYEAPKDDSIYVNYPTEISNGQISWNVAVYDLDGNLKNTINDTEISSIGDGSIVYKKGDYYGAIKTDGTPLIDCIWKYLVSAGYDLFETNNAIIDKDGNVVIQNIDNSTPLHFYNGYLNAYNTVDKKLLYYDNKGKAIPDNPVLTKINSTSNIVLATDFSDTGLAASLTSSSDAEFVLSPNKMNGFTIYNKNMDIILNGTYTSSESVDKNLYFKNTTIISFLNAGLFPVNTADGIKILKIDKKYLSK